MKIKLDNPIQIQRLQLYVSIAALVVTTIGVTFTICIRTTVRDGVKVIEKDILTNQFIITNPVDNTLVDNIDLVRGKTPFLKLNHYIVVTPLKTGDDWVEDGPLKIYTGGLWTGRARFGTAAAGPGDEFVVRALVTKSILSRGPLTKLPVDAIFSNSVIVTRRR